MTRDELLDINGIGEETADRTLLYACGKLVWPVDTYCRRVLAHHCVIPPQPDKPTARQKRELAATIKDLVGTQMPRDVVAWQRLHVLMQIDGEDRRGRGQPTV